MAEQRQDPTVGQRGMGRGLAAILPRSGEAETGWREVPLELVEPNACQPRREFDEDALLALSESIKSRGVLQPVVVRPLAGGRYELVAGERRLRAAKIAGLQAIPAVIRQTDDRDRLDLALAENMARVDLNPIEEARACAMLVEDLGLSKAEVGRRVGKSRVAVSNLVRLLELPDEAVELIEAGALSEAHGRALLTCRDHDGRRRLARSAREHGWSVRETERRARAAEADAGRPGAGRQVVLHPDQAEALAAVEDSLTAALGRPVRVRAKGEGCVAELDFEVAGEAIELAERLLGRGARNTARAA